MISVGTRRTAAGNGIMVSITQKWDVREKLAGEEGVFSVKNSEQFALLGGPLGILCDLNTTACITLASSPGFTTSQGS